MISMKKVLVPIIVTIMAGYAGIIIGASINAEGYLGNIFAIASMGGFILKAIEGKKPTDTETK